eukprot:COSAG02_NODE_2779_length_8046_cov_3.495533_3_plen_48_part_00
MKSGVAGTGGVAWASWLILGVQAAVGANVAGVEMIGAGVWLRVLVVR